MGYLHSLDKPICLRGLCPSNILLQADGKLRLVNIEAAVLSNLTNFLGGADLLQPGFAAPERFVGNDDTRADIFSLGMVLHYLATGVDTTQPPYNAGPIREYRPDLPHWFEKIIEKCIEIDPQKRFQNCDELELYLTNQYTPSVDSCITKLLTADKYNGSRIVFGRGTWLRTNCTIFTDGSYKKVSIYDKIDSMLGTEPKPKQFFTEKGTLSSSDLSALKRILKYNFKDCKGGAAFDANWWEIKSYDKYGKVEHKYVGSTDFSGADKTINMIGQIIPKGKLDEVHPDQRMAYAFQEILKER